VIAPGQQPIEQGPPAIEQVPRGIERATEEQPRLDLVIPWVS
jgi:hypothetical protein